MCSNNAAAGMNVGQSKLNWDGIQLESPALRVTGKGFIDFDQTMNFELVAHTQGSATQMLNKVAGLQSGGQFSASGRDP